MTRRLLFTIAVLLAAMAAAPGLPRADACPMCKAANESGETSAAQDARPRAYMYSILFMLSMPATLFAGFGVGFYRLHKKQQRSDAEREWPTA